PKKRKGGLIMAQRIIFPAKQQVVLEDFTPPEMTDDLITVRTLHSLMSTGTENIIFNHDFDPGTHWASFVKYPCPIGYSTVGEVVEVGANVTTLNVGDRVGMGTPHASVHVVPPSRCVAVPQKVHPGEAAWFSLAKIALHGADRAAYRLGESAL